MILTDNTVQIEHLAYPLVVIYTNLHPIKLRSSTNRGIIFISRSYDSDNLFTDTNPVFPPLESSF